MAGHSTHSNGHVEVAVAGMREEAKKWHRLSDSMQTVFNRIENLYLVEFSVADIHSMFPMFPLAEDYSEGHTTYRVMIKRAYEEFAALGDALNKCADRYEETDGKTARAFDEIATA